MCRKTVIIATLLVSAGVCLAERNNEPGTGAKSVKTYGGAVVRKVICVDRGFSFRCDIKGWPAVIADDIAVKIDGITPPLIVAKGGKPNKFFDLQSVKFLERTFAGARSVRLENIKRGRTFSIVADVIVDSNSVADLLIGAGLARCSVEGGQASITAANGVSAGYDENTSITRPGADEGINTDVASEAFYVASKNSKVFHRPGCRYAKIVSGENLVRFDSKAEALQTGRRPCKTCNP
ncbi:MAG TPA: hypothetical protein HPP87_06275 [Planctomycetes bacterium]|nr:hypothetical protein [Planctomycetota bacterium]